MPASHEEFDLDVAGGTCDSIPRAIAVPGRCAQAPGSAASMNAFRPGKYGLSIIFRRLFGPGRASVGGETTARGPRPQRGRRVSLYSIIGCVIARGGFGSLAFDSMRERRGWRDEPLAAVPTATICGVNWNFSKIPNRNNDLQRNFDHDCVLFVQHPLENGLSRAFRSGSFVACAEVLGNCDRATEGGIPRSSR